MNFRIREVQSVGNPFWESFVLSNSGTQDVVITELGPLPGTPFQTTVEEQLPVLLRRNQPLAFNCTYVQGMSLSAIVVIVEGEDEWIHVSMPGRTQLHIT